VLPARERLRIEGAIAKRLESVYVAGDPVTTLAQGQDGGVEGAPRQVGGLSTLRECNGQGP